MPHYGELAAGAFFGCALLASGMYAPQVIQAQMTFSSNAMIAVMMGASASSAIIFEIADRTGWMPKSHRAPTTVHLFPFDGNILGGALIGVGMVLSGACPGTGLVQLAHGACWVPLGGVLGGLVFVRLQPALQGTPGAAAETGKGGNNGNSTAKDVQFDKLAYNPVRAPRRPLDFASLLGVKSWVVVLAWVPMCLAVIWLAFAKDPSTRIAPASGLIAPVYGGILIGLAQLATAVLTHHSIGASGAYEDIGRWINTAILRQPHAGENPPSLVTPSVFFAAGVTLAATGASQVLFQNGILEPTLSFSRDYHVALSSLAAGCAMVLGARVAGGCTSGHGISGLAKFSTSSLVTTAAMFASGVATARVAGL